LIAKKREKETGDSLTKRLEITAAMNFNFALLYPETGGDTVRDISNTVLIKTFLNNGIFVLY
jgi:hypothetical protein